MSALHSPSRSFPAALALLAGGLVLNSALGPLGADVVRYPITATVRSQLIGLEVVSLVLVVPASLWAAWLWVRRHPAAPVVAFAPAAYTAYMFVQYVVGPLYTSWTLALLLHLALFTGGLVLTVWAWVECVREAADLPVPAPRRARWFAGVLVGLAVFVVARYLPGILGAGSETALPREVVEEPAFYWSIVLLDLGVVVPGALAAGVALWRGARLGAAGLYAVTGWFTLVPPSVAAMGAVMVLQDDEFADAGQVVVLGVASVVFAAFALVVFRPLFRSVARAAGADEPRRERVSARTR